MTARDGEVPEDPRKTEWDVIQNVELGTASTVGELMVILSGMPPDLSLHPWNYADGDADEVPPIFRVTSYRDGNGKMIGITLEAQE